MEFITEIKSAHAATNFPDFLDEIGNGCPLTLKQQREGYELFKERVKEKILPVYQKHCDGLVRYLAPDLKGDFLLGGAHRLWVKDSARRTAEFYMKDCVELKRKSECPQMLPHAKIDIPMPKSWNGKRPDECEEWGHSASAFKDYRHFENALRFYLAKGGFIALVCRALDDHKALLLVADEITQQALRPAQYAEDFSFINCELVPFTAPEGYDRFCDRVNREWKATEERAADMD
jgi:hypothetical protein